MTGQDPSKAPLSIAIGMVTGVRDDGRAAIYQTGAQLPHDVLLDVMVHLAEMVPDTKRLSDLLAWKTDRKPRHRLLARPRPVDLGDCPSQAAYARHVANGEPIDAACEAAHGRYERGYTLRRAA